MAGIGKPPEQYEIEDFVTDESFVNYFFHLNPEDIVFWEKWVSANPSCKETVDAAKEMLRSLTLTLTDQELEDETAKLKAAIAPAVVRSLPFSRTKRLAAVAALVILLAGGYLLELTIHSDRVMEKFNRTNDPIVFSLADGTTVTLAPQSVLHYAADFGDKERTVSLNGEAQFDVSRKTDHPFIVQENELVVTVLGTLFSVKNQPGDSVMVVELIKGRLKVESMNSKGQPSGSIILNPDERVIYKRHDDQLYKERWQSQAETPVQVGHIQFIRNNFDEIAARLKAAFGITVINQSKKRNWMFSGEFENATAEEIVKNICVVERLNFQTIGDTIFIK
jgi:ferric-dicitrate binding protein FerR (iron transport regulator)